MVIGIDLGGMSAKAALLNKGVLTGKTSVATSKEDTPETTAQNLACLAFKVAEKAGIKIRRNYCNRNSLSRSSRQQNGKGRQLD